MCVSKSWQLAAGYVGMASVENNKGQPGTRHRQFQPALRDPPQVTAKPISQPGSASGKEYLRKGNNTRKQRGGGDVMWELPEETLGLEKEDKDENKDEEDRGKEYDNSYSDDSDKDDDDEEVVFQMLEQRFTVKLVKNPWQSKWIFVKEPCPE